MKNKDISDYELKKQKALLEINDGKSKQNTEKLYVLCRLLETHIIDEDKTILASEPAFKPAFDDQERELLKRKVFDIVKEL